MKYLLLAFLLSFLSCNKIDSKIDSHFKKFILVNKLKEYKINKIERKIGDTLTIKKKKINNIHNYIKEIENNIYEFKYNNDKLREDIINIEKAKIKTKYGMTIYDGVERYGNIIIYKNMPNYEYGKKRDIAKREKLITENISEINNLIKQKELKSLEIEKIKKTNNENDNEILELKSSVEIKGIIASGEDYHLYEVIQYKNGEIKKIRKIN
ncbi:hypothetical protein [Amniculibacterium sp. G2-70]|uniref:hypothetical protein n=1 Tax=Amniculibacterium sp. G2-70 TaxID=2767188 RepID=UPI001654B0D6|nr:hypothetical protein [Amniculibacterium sp. G2-70]